MWQADGRLHRAETLGMKLHTRQWGAGLNHMTERKKSNLDLRNAGDKIEIFSDKLVIVGERDHKAVILF